MEQLEVCVDGVAGTRIAAACGVARIELCCGLELGGLTPSQGLLDGVLAAGAPDTVVLVRPRAGDFVYSDVELDIMRRDVVSLRAAGASGVATGALQPDGSVDLRAMAALVAAARPLGVTFHRAFDSVIDPLQSLDELAELGVERILTSGGAASCIQGAERIAQLIEHARGRLVVMPGGGVRADNIVGLVEATGASEIHLSAGVWVPSAMRRSVPGPRLGPGDQEAGRRRATSADELRHCVEALARRSRDEP